MFGIDQGQDRVEQIALGNFVIHEEGLRYRPRISQPGGLDDHPLEHQFTAAPFGRQVAQGRAQILADRATDAAIVHLDDLLLRLGHQDLGIDVLFAEFVFDHRNLLSMSFGQYALEQGGFA